jgi:dTDP-4-dehydrorhamnose 3,5-epimerase
VNASVIAGVERRTLEPHTDERGTLREVWRGSRQPFEVRQVLATTSRAGALRGMHYHLRQADLCYVPVGRVFMALVDLRAEPYAREELRLSDGESVLIPAGVAHGYVAEVDATVCYLLSAEVDGSDEFGFRFDDPGLGIHWPVARPILSARDRDAGTFAAAVQHIRARLASGVRP